MRIATSYQVPVVLETFPKILEQTRPGNAGQPPRLLDQIREVIRRKHYSLRTEEVYVDWARRFVRFCGLRHPREMGNEEVNMFLTHLAVEEQLSASTQNQALAALLFLYRELLERDLNLDGVVRARTRQRLPVVLTTPVLLPSAPVVTPLFVPSFSSTVTIVSPSVLVLTSTLSSPTSATPISPPLVSTCILSRCSPNNTNHQARAIFHVLIMRPYNYRSLQRLLFLPKSVFTRLTTMFFA